MIVKCVHWCACLQLVLMEATGSFKWEGGDNRTLSLPPPASSDTTYIMHMDYGMPANEYIAVMHQPEVK